MLAAGCSTWRESPTALNQQAAYYNYLQPTFNRYVEVSTQWLTSHRDFISDDPAREVSMNAPFIRLANGESKGAAMLVHGLGDSPYSFSDIADSLNEQGLDVYAILLPGHGSRPEDMLLPQYADWQTIVDHYAGQLQKRYDTLWLGGFSTGANLVTHYALEHGGVDGLLLFSPAYQTHSPILEKLTPIAASLFDWGWKVPEDNLARYTSTTFNGARAYAQSAEAVRDALKQNEVTIPALLLLSEADSVVDAEQIKQLFTERFTHPASRLIWHGKEDRSENRIRSVNMVIPTFRILSGSHMSVLFKPCNPYYGFRAEKRICHNSLDSAMTQRCQQADKVYSGAWGAYDGDLPYSRLTWNPYYYEFEQQLKTLLGKQQQLAEAKL